MTPKDNEGTTFIYAWTCKISGGELTARLASSVEIKGRYKTKMLVFYHPFYTVIQRHRFLQWSMGMNNVIGLLRWRSNAGFQKNLEDYWGHEFDGDWNITILYHAVTIINFTPQTHCSPLRFFLTKCIVCRHITSSSSTFIPFFQRLEMIAFYINTSITNTVMKLDNVIVCV